jgi:hypothetical protein
VRLRQLIEHHEDHLLALEEACVDDEPMAMESPWPWTYCRYCSSGNWTSNR